MIMIFGTLCKMIFLKVLIFFGFYWGKRAKGGPKWGGGGRLKGQKIVQMTKNYVVLYISGTIHNMIVIYSTQV